MTGERRKSQAKTAISNPVPSLSQSRIIHVIPTCKPFYIEQIARSAIVMFPTP